MKRDRHIIHVLIKEKGWFRPRNADGSWKAWPENARLKEWYGCIEVKLLISKAGLCRTMFREWLN